MKKVAYLSLGKVGVILASLKSSLFRLSKSRRKTEKIKNHFIIHRERTGVYERFKRNSVKRRKETGRYCPEDKKTDGRRSGRKFAGFGF